MNQTIKLWIIIVSIALAFVFGSLALAYYSVPEDQRPPIIIDNDTKIDNKTDPIIPPDPTEENKTIENNTDEVFTHNFTDLTPLDN